MTDDTVIFDTCQWIGPDQDPWRHWPIQMCGCKTLEKKAYCAEHYWRVYEKGTSVNGKRKSRAIEQEIEELKRQQELEEIDNE
jgi:hypothetical protein